MDLESGETHQPRKHPVKKDIVMPKDSDKETDTAQLEQEDWIAYIKKKYSRGRRKHEYSQDSILDRGAQKNGVATGDEKSIATKRTMGRKSSRMESKTQQQN